MPLDLPAEMQSRDYAEVSVMSQMVKGACIELVKHFMPRDRRVAHFCIPFAGPSADVATHALRGVVDCIQYDPYVCVRSANATAYSLATCFFGIPSLFRDEQMVKRFLTAVASTLAPGGVFVGACPDAKEVIKLITEDAVAFASHRVHVERLWTGTPSAYGSMYEHKIRYKLGWSDTRSRHREYLVFESVLKSVAESCGLVPVKWAHSTRQMSALLCQPHTRHQLFRRFRPNTGAFGAGKHDLFDVCSTYAAFAFVKR